MGGRGRVQSLAASPTMVGAITTLIVIVAVFLAYNANQGLPFVPVYRISAELPNAARLGANNEVRVGGNRVGVIESIETTDNEATGEEAAKLNLKLDKSAQPIPEDTTVKVRYRSSFGLKYLELERGTGDPLPEGGTLSIAQAQEQTEFDDIANTFDEPTREASRTNLIEFGSAFAGRGASLNQAIENLSPLFLNLRPVARNLASPATNLVRFFPELADAARLVAPIAAENAEQFTNMAISFAALSSDPEALKDAIASTPPVLRAGIRSLPKQRPFLRDFATASRLLRPGVRQLRKALPALNTTLRIGTPVLLRTPPMNAELRGVFGELEALVDQPETKVSLIRLGDTFDSARTAGEAIVPVQTVCNYWNYWFTYLTEHITQRDQVGFSQRVVLVSPPGATSPGEYPMNPLAAYAGLPANGRNSLVNPPGVAGVFDPHHQPILHGSPYADAGTQQNPDCQAGQTGYPIGHAPSPGQSLDLPVFGVKSIADTLGLPGVGGEPALGRSDMFLLKDGTRRFKSAP